MANEVRLIDANALREKAKWMKDQFGLPVRGIPISELGVAPTIDPESLRPLGRWKYGIRAAVCTNCGFERHLDDNFGRALSCPNCDAKMEW